MVKITKEVYQCDFCGHIDITLPECIICGKNFCPKHGFNVEVTLEQGRMDSTKVKPVFSMANYVCIECRSERSTILRKIAVALKNKADEMDAEPPPEEP